jgi:hypothetical protein
MRSMRDGAARLQQRRTRSSRTHAPLGVATAAAVPCTAQAGGTSVPLVNRRSDESLRAEMLFRMQQQNCLFPVGQFSFQLVSTLLA